MKEARIGYYHKKEVATLKMYGALREIKGKLAQGYTWTAHGRSPGEREISLRAFLPSRGISTSMAPFVSTFDYARPITPSRVAIEREKFLVQVQIDRALRKAGVKKSRRGCKAVAPEQKRKAGRPRKEPVAVAVAVPDVRLLNWEFTGSMRGITLSWGIRDGGILTTAHSLEPQTGYYEEGAGDTMRFRRISGSFKEGKLTADEQRRILEEGRSFVHTAHPRLVLEPIEDSVKRFRHLMR